MKKQLILAAMMLMAVPAGFAANQEEGMAPDTMMGMMNHEQMMQMHQHMQEMQQLMADIRKEEDPDRRMALMEEHRLRMNKAMGTMGGAMMGHAGGDKMAAMTMEERMQMMQNQMGMMGMMMEQMMQHYSEDKGHHGQ